MLAMLLLDENTSPRIVQRLWEQGVDAIHVRDRGLLQAPDHVLWRIAKEQSRTIVTINGRDFRKLAVSSDEAHPGILVIPSGGAPDAQFDFIMSAVRWVSMANAATGFSNRYIEVNERGEIILAEVTFSSR